jgi:hypothetical protein
MLKKLSVTAVILAMSAMLLVPTAYAVQSVDAPAQEEENCIKTLLELLAGDTEKNESAGQESLFRKNGFKIQDGRLYHYTDGQLDVYQPGFVQIGDDVYHVSAEGSVIDSCPAGFVVVDGVLCHVSVTGGSFDLYPAGFVTIDGKLYHVSKNGYSIDRYAKGLHEIDGGMYYVKEDGSFLTNSAVGYLTFDANGRYTSGNATLDSYVDQALAACTNSGMTEAQKLRAAYLYVRDHGAYLARPHQARGTTAWAEESALFMFEHKKGNCYCFAGQFLYMARRLGYNAYVVSGGVGRKDSDHAWVVICENGVPYIYDVELEWGYRAGRYGHAEYNMYKMPLNKTVFSYQFP